MDFIKKYNFILDFNEENDHLVFHPSNLSHTMEIPITNNYNEITLPKKIRSNYIIRKFNKEFLYQTSWLNQIEHLSAS